MHQGISSQAKINHNFSLECIYRSYFTVSESHLNVCITIVIHRCISEYYVWVFKGSQLAAIFHRLKGPFIQALRFKATLKWHNGEVVAFWSF